MGNLFGGGSKAPPAQRQPEVSQQDQAVLVCFNGKVLCGILVFFSIESQPTKRLLTQSTEAQEPKRPTDAVQKEGTNKLSSICSDCCLQILLTIEKERAAAKQLVHAGQRESENSSLSEC
jgi:hypothetical protein